MLIVIITSITIIINVIISSSSSSSSSRIWRVQTRTRTRLVRRLETRRCLRMYASAINNDSYDY